MSVITRFAPSPTGHLHVGGLRTALFNWLFARHFGGEFLVRIDDTDQERSKLEFTKGIFNALNWVGINSDREAEFQSDYSFRHREFAHYLVDSGFAYKADDGTTRLMKAKEQDLSFVDLVYGEVKFHSNNVPIEGHVILKSNGMPTYNLACVVDDFAAGITHIFRGEDHLSNTPLQIYLYRCFDKEFPQFGHLPMILGPDKQKYSKRNGASSVLEFKEQGILPQALLNYLARLGWSHPDLEVNELNQMISLFDGTGLNKKACVFDQKKLEWVNSQHIKNLDYFDVCKLCPGLHVKEVASEKHLETFCSVVTKRSANLLELQDLAYRFTANWADLNLKPNPKNKTTLQEMYCFDLAMRLDNNWENRETVLKDVIKEREAEPKQFYPLILSSLIGLQSGPSVLEVFDILGKEETLRRLCILWREKC